MLTQISRHGKCSKFSPVTFFPSFNITLQLDALKNLSCTTLTRIMQTFSVLLPSSHTTPTAISGTPTDVLAA
jgi:hypothetical protein